jgi:hypothetical protein
MSSWAFQPLSSATAAVSTAKTGIFRYWNGSEWIVGDLNRFESDEFKFIKEIQYWDGDKWELILFNSPIL